MVTMRVGADGSASTLARSRFTWTSSVLVSPDVVGAPHPVDQGLAGEHPAGVGQQDLEQLELLERQLHRVAPDDDLVALGVEGHVADLEGVAAEGGGGGARRPGGAARPASGPPARGGGTAW